MANGTKTKAKVACVLASDFEDSEFYDRMTRARREASSRPLSLITRAFGLCQNSVSGEIVFNGKFLPGGIYSFKTSEGNMRLLIPPESSCRLVAWYGFGTITSELPIKVQTRDASSGGKSLRATIGEGDATLNLTTNRGRIVIAKQSHVP